MIDPTRLVVHERDLPVDEQAWGTLHWLGNERLLPGAEQTFGRCVLLPGRGNPLHYHPNCEEMLYVLSGTGRHLLEDRWVEVTAGSLVRIPAGMKHRLRNEGGEPLDCILAFSSGDRRTVFLEEDASPP